MSGKRILSIANWVLGFYAAIMLLALTDLQGVKELIEVHHYQKCWLYSSFHTYVTDTTVMAALTVTAFVISWVLLKTKYWRFAAILLAAAVLLIIVDTWRAGDCWP